MNTQSFTIFTSLLLLSIGPLHAQIPDDWTGGWGDRAKAAIGEYVSDEDIEKAKDSAKKLTKSSRDLYDEFLQEIQDLEIKKIIDPVDEPDDAVVDVVEDDVPEAEEGRVIVADLYDKDRLRDLLEQEFIVANTQKLTIQFKSKSKAQKDALIKSIEKFFAKTYIFKSTRIYSTPKGITISGQWDSAIYLAKAYQGVYPMSKLNEREKEAISLLKKQLPAIIKNKSSDYDKALAIHDWLVTHVNYQKKELHQTAEQAIVKGYGVCAGYARAYTVMLGAVGIPSTVILGNKHAWNFVRADGKWMHVDVTWDDGHTPDNNNIIYTFFGLNHEEMTLVHSQLRLVVR